MIRARPTFKPTVPHLTMLCGAAVCSACYACPMPNVEAFVEHVKIAHAEYYDEVVKQMEKQK